MTPQEREAYYERRNELWILIAVVISILGLTVIVAIGILDPNSTLKMLNNQSSPSPTGYSQVQTADYQA